MPDGYYNPTRLVLTVLLNLNKFEISKDRIIDNDYQVNYYNKSTGIVDVVKELQFVYPIDVILKVIENYFLCFKKSWSHLVTIHGFHLTKKDQLLKDMKGRLSEFIENPNKQEDLKLKKIRVKVNPSGYIYLRYIIPHFEFFSRRINNTRPLFLATKYDNREKKYQFEIFIDAVYKKVKVCIEDMRAFYRGVFTDRMNLGVEDFLYSNYSFKYKKNQYLDIGEFFDQQHTSKGNFYSSRIIENHIGYIEAFRIFILNNKYIQRKLRLDLSKLTLVELNKVLISKIKKFNNLYSVINSNERNLNFQKSFDECIKRIEEHDYKNFRLLVSAHTKEL
jgi:hypothetical protein